MLAITVLLAFGTLTAGASRELELHPSDLHTTTYVSEPEADGRITLTSKQVVAGKPISVTQTIGPHVHPPSSPPQLNGVQVQRPTNLVPIQIQFRAAPTQVHSFIYPFPLLRLVPMVIALPPTAQVFHPVYSHPFNPNNLLTGNRKAATRSGNGDKESSSCSVAGPGGAVGKVNCTAKSIK